MPKFCSNCGKPLQDRNTEICPSCGLRVWSLPPQPEKRNPWIAVLLSFFFIGWGQWYNGRTWDGLKLFGLMSWAYLLLFLFSIFSFVAGVVNHGSFGPPLLLVYPLAFLSFFFLALLPGFFSTIGQFPVSLIPECLPIILALVVLGTGIYYLYAIHPRKGESRGESWLFWLSVAFVFFSITLFVTPHLLRGDYVSSALLVATFIGYLLPLLAMLTICIIGMYDSYRTSRRINRLDVEFKEKSGFFWLPIGSFLVLILIVAGTTIIPYSFGMLFPPRPDITIVNAFWQGGTGYAKIWLNNTGSNPVALRDLDRSSVLVGTPNNIGPVTLDNSTEGWSYVILGVRASGRWWNPGETVEIMVVSARFPTDSGKTVDFQIILPDGTKRSAEFTVICGGCD
jgi:hypothetical protein